MTQLRLIDTAALTCQNKDVPFRHFALTELRGGSNNADRRKGSTVSILITGGAGYIGSHVAALFRQTGLDVVVLDNLASGRRERVAPTAFVCADIADREKVRKVLRAHKVTCVVHLAARTHAAESVTRPHLYFETNVLGTLALLDAMVVEGVQRFVFASSCSVYGDAVSAAACEGDAVVPVSPYGASKLAIEQVLPEHERAHGLRWIALRYFNVAGAGPGFGEDLLAATRIMPLAIRTALWGNPSLKVFGASFPTPDGTAVRDYVHVADIARANLLALRYLDQGHSGAVLNLGSGRGTSVLEILRTVSRLATRNVPYAVEPARAGDPAFVVSDVSKAAKVLGWRPTTSEIRSIVSSALEAARVDVDVSAIA